MFHDTSKYSFVPDLEAAWKDVYEEYCTVQNEVEDWVERDLYNNGWQVYRLFEFPHGEPIQSQCVKCPKTTAVIRSCFPHHGVAGFSILQPQAVVCPHQGYQGEFLRCHLGLSIPQGDCLLEVNKEQRFWQAGKAMIFDDRLPHAAWNRTSEHRVVLLVDFVPDVTI